MTRRVAMITGATGLVGSQVAETLSRAGFGIRALVRPGSPEQAFLKGLGATLVVGDLLDAPSLANALDGATDVVHCAALVGDWGPAEPYRLVNVRSLATLLAAARAAALRRFVMISSLGVYEPRDHHGTDETTPLCLAGFDPYTRTKAESEQLVLSAARDGLPVIVLRPGFIYGPRDRQVMPRLVETLEAGRFLFVGKGEQILNHTGVRNLAGAVLLALTKDLPSGEVFNITDAPLQSRKVFIGHVAAALGVPVPARSIPPWLARPLAVAMDRGYRALRRPEPPLLSMARYKFLALNLDYSIAKARRVLGYAPEVSLESGIAEAVRWYRDRRAAEQRLPGDG
jgi:nucleoside-diphosphate-sugar epimerase